MKSKRLVVVISYALVLGTMTACATSQIQMKYGSADAMREAVQGQYQCYYQGKAIDSHLLIDGDAVIHVFYLDGKETPLQYTIEKWDYERGYFLANSEKYIVANNETIKAGNSEYIKADTLLFPLQDMLDDMNRKYEELEDSKERGEDVLKVSYYYVEHNSSYTVCTGSLKNEGKKTYRFVKVKGAFEDSSGNVLDIDSSYVVGSEGLSQGESCTFHLSVPKNSKIESCTVTVYDYEAQKGAME